MRTLKVVKKDKSIQFFFSSSGKGVMTDVVWTVIAFSDINAGTQTLSTHWMQKKMITG